MGVFVDTWERLGTQLCEVTAALSFTLPQELLQAGTAQKPPALTAPFSVCCLKMLKAALLSPCFIISQVCQTDEAGFTTCLFLHMD